MEWRLFMAILLLGGWRLAFATGMPHCNRHAADRHDELQEI
jgi:hypothetical protein